MIWKKKSAAALGNGDLNESGGAELWKRVLNRKQRKRDQKIKR